MKRLLDIIISSIALLLLFPLIVSILMLTAILLGEPVFFRQTRTGLHGKLFTIFKVRTMKEAADSGGESLPDGQRITRFGRFLRKSSLDELPELLNVIKGDMAIVGPRPLLPEYLPLYSQKQMRRHEVRPGITGWAQVNGRNAIGWEERFNLDVWYVDHQSLALDFKIILLTVLRVFRQDGITSQGHETMPKFTGNSGRKE